MRASNKNKWTEASRHPLDIQEQERVSLESIFGSDFVPVDRLSLRIKLIPYTDKPQLNFSSLTLFVRFSPNYPFSAPEWNIESTVNLSSQEIAELRSSIKTFIKESLGAEMIFGVTKVIEGFLQSHNTEPVSLLDKMLARKKKKEEQQKEEERLQIEAKQAEFERTIAEGLRRNERTMTMRQGKGKTLNSTQATPSDSTASPSSSFFDWTTDPFTSGGSSKITSSSTNEVGRSNHNNLDKPIAVKKKPTTKPIPIRWKKTSESGATCCGNLFGGINRDNGLYSFFLFFVILKPRFFSRGILLLGLYS